MTELGIRINCSPSKCEQCMYLRCTQAGMLQYSCDLFREAFSTPYRIGKCLEAENRFRTRSSKELDALCVKVKLLVPEAKLPTMGSGEAACFDLYSLESTTISPEKVTRVRTGLALEIPRGYEIEIRPRSSLSVSLDLVNSPATIDSDYRGEILLLFIARFCPVDMSKGDRIAQLKVNKVYPTVFLPVLELLDTSRGDKGFGSTGK